MALGFKDYEIKNIEAEPMLISQGAKGYLREMLGQWLQWGPGDGRGSKDFANSEDLWKALHLVGLPDLAIKVDGMLHS